MIKVQITGLDVGRNAMDRAIKQVPFAASRALNTMARKANDAVKAEMSKTFAGGPTAYALRAFEVKRASKINLTAVLQLRKDAPAGGTPYDKAFRHLFTAGTRDWKKVEGLFTGMGIVPPGMMIVPGRACPLDARGNIRRNTLKEIIGALRSSIRSVKIYRKGTKKTGPQAIGYFVTPPKSRLFPGIWKRTQSENGSTVKPIIMFVRPGTWRKMIDLDIIGERTIRDHWKTEFNRELAAALATAK